MTKSQLPISRCGGVLLVTHTVIPIAIAQIVMYSDLLTLCRVSQTASMSKSIPRTRMRAPTTMTAASQWCHTLPDGRLRK